MIKSEAVQSIDSAHWPVWVDARTAAGAHVMTWHIERPKDYEDFVEWASPALLYHVRA